MTRYGLYACSVLVLAVACKKDATFIEPLPNYAAITWLNAVSDTGQLDLRVIDIVSNASFMDADFRSAQPFPVNIEPGARRIKVFLSSGVDSIAQKFLLDTTFTFAESQPYFFYLRGQTRAGTFGASIVSLAPPTPPAGQFAIRFLNLAPSVAGAIRGAPDTAAAPDIFITRRNALASGAPAVAGLAFGAMSPYVLVDTGAYRVQLLAPGATDPVMVQATIPPGTAASPGTPAIAGSRISGSVLTAVIVPRSNPDTLNPVLHSRPSSQRTDTSVSEASRRITRNGDTVTVQVGSITVLTNRRSSSGAARADSTIARTGTGGASPVSAGQVILVTGAAQTEYNGWQEVLSVADTLICSPADPADVVTDFAQAPELDGDAWRLDYRYGSRNWFGQYWHQELDPTFRADSGFISRVGVVQDRFEMQRTWYGNGDAWYTDWRTGIQGNRNETSDGQLISRSIQPFITFQGPLQSFARLGAGASKEDWLGQGYDKQGGFMFGQVRPRSGLSISMEVQRGEQIDYTNARLADSRRWGPQVDWNATRHLLVRLRYTKDRLSAQDGPTIYDARLTDLRLTWQFNVRSFVRLTLQDQDVDRNLALYDADPDNDPNTPPPILPPARTKTLASQLLYSYKLNPQTVLFAGYSDNSIEDPTTRQLEKTGRTLFFKLSYAWTP